MPRKYTRVAPLVPAEVRFWAKVDKNGPIIRPELGPCWVWTGASVPFGYGKFGLRGVCATAHRLSFEWGTGISPVGSLVLHHCDNPPCVNNGVDSPWPSHLFLGTQDDNMKDMYRKGRSAAGSKNGHAVLSGQQVAAIRTRYAAGGVTQAELAQHYGTRQGHISRIVNGRRWA